MSAGPVREQPHRVLAEMRLSRLTAPRAAGRPRSRPPASSSLCISLERSTSMVSPPSGTSSAGSSPRRRNSPRGSCTSTLHFGPAAQKSPSSGTAARAIAPTSVASRVSSRTVAAQRPSRVRRQFPALSGYASSATCCRPHHISCSGLSGVGQAGGRQRDCAGRARSGPFRLLKAGHKRVDRRRGRGCQDFWPSLAAVTA